MKLLSIKYYLHIHCLLYTSGEIAEIEDSTGETIWVFNTEGSDYFGVSYHERSDSKITELTHLLTIEIPNEQILDKLITGQNREDL